MKLLRLLCLTLLIFCLALPALAEGPLLRAGGSFAVAIDAQGQIWAWGDNVRGQLGNGTAKRVPFPSPAGEGLQGSDVADIQCGNENTLFLMKDGTVYTCGNNNYGQQGDGGAAGAVTIPWQIPELRDIVQVATGYGHCLARTADGHVWAWGRNNCGQLGTGSKKAEKRPVQLPLEHITDVQCGGKFSMVMAEDGTIWGWGANDQGQLLDAVRKGQNLLQPTQLSVSGRFTRIAPGGSTVYAIDPDGVLWAWGRNNYLQLGTKAVKAQSSEPVRVELPEGLAIADLYAYNTHAGILTPDNALWQWGMTRCGQLGSGKHPTSSLPTLCDAGQPVLAAAVGSSGSYAMLADGTVWACGYSEVYQTGAFRKVHYYVYDWTYNGLNLLTSTWEDPHND